MFKPVESLVRKENVVEARAGHHRCLFCNERCLTYFVTLKGGERLVICHKCGSIHKSQRVKAYVKGRRFEYQVKRLLESQGFTVFRLAGSKPLDLVAVRNGKVMFVECKANPSISGVDRDRLGKWSFKLGCPVSLFLKDGNSILVEFFEAKPRKHWRNTFELLNDFMQFLYDNHHVPESFGNLDWEKIICNFLFGSEEK